MLNFRQLIDWQYHQTKSQFLMHFIILILQFIQRMMSGGRTSRGRTRCGQARRFRYAALSNDKSSGPFHLLWKQLSGHQGLIRVPVRAISPGRGCREKPDGGPGDLQRDRRRVRTRRV